MNHLTFNNTVINYRRIKRIAEKTMVFVIPVVKVGVVPTEIRFPTKGRLTDIHVSCATTGHTETVIDLEKCPQSVYDSELSPMWTSVLENKVVVEPWQKSNRTSRTPYSFSDDSVSEGDHFRVNILTAGQGVQYMTVEVSVEVDVEE